MPFSSTFSTPSDYSHHYHYTTAAERDQAAIPYLGGPEDRIVAAYVDVYRSLANVMRTDSFRQQMAEAMRVGSGQAMALIDGYLDGAGVQFRSRIIDELAKVITAAASQSKLAVVAQIPVQIPDAAQMPQDALSKAASASATRSARHPIRRLRVPIRIPRLHIARSSQHGVFRSSHSHREAASRLANGLIVQVSDSQRQKIHQTILEAFLRAFSPDEVSEQVSVIVGLFPRWQSAVDNLTARMISNGVPLHIVRQRAADYQDQLIHKRASMIARTELMTAMNRGRLLGWQEIADLGHLDAENSIKTWIAAPGACNECQSMMDPDATGEPRGTVVGIDTPFITPYGPIDMPPLHPHCRCTVSLTRVAPEKGSTTPAPISEHDINTTALNDPEMAYLLNNMPAAS